MNGLQPRPSGELWESPLLPVPTANTVTTLAHPMRRVRWAVGFLVCRQPEFGYVPGDVIPLRSIGNNTNNINWNLNWNGSSVTAINAGASYVLRKDNGNFGALTAAKWALQLRVYPA
jgi:hypothetical protein